jgi:hypothetical protein
MAEQTARKGLWEPILDQGIYNTHFFNGRLLTAVDLKTEQDANRRQHQQLGQAIGAGVVQGLEVRLIADGADGRVPLVSVTSGLALNRAGQAVALSVDLPEVMLARQSEAIPPDAGLFAACGKPPQNGTTPTGTGVYLLVAFPASEFRGRVPMRGIDEPGKIEGCGSRYAVEGLQFRLVALQLDRLTGLSQTTHTLVNNLMTAHAQDSLSQLRNLLAHICFGTEEQAGFVRDPLRRVRNQSPYTAYGAVEALRTTGVLTDCDVPLALLYWPSGVVQFVDMWSVRRRPIPPLLSTAWPLPVVPRRLADMEAVFLQFQEHIDWLLGSTLSQGALATLPATDYFRYLPPAGFLPLSQGSFRGITPGAFFSQQPHRDPEFMSGAAIPALFNTAITYEPIDMAAGELVWLYSIWQNTKAIDDGETIPPYIVFTSGHMPHLGLARFDVARWNYSNYAEGTLHT